MGHAVNPDREYQLLQKHLDKTLTGAPDSPAFMKILKLLFPPQDAMRARKMPLTPMPVKVVAKNLGMPLDEVDSWITDMARRGLVVDIHMDRGRLVMLAPVVIGFFEYTFMRTRDEAPMKEIAKLFKAYMFDDEKLAKSIFQGQTQIGRSLVNENALPEGDFTEILDWERASKVVEDATQVAVSLCACRHHHTHLGEACDKPLRTCLTLNHGASILLKAGIGEEISNGEALSILQECRELGLAQTGDNVQQNMSYICNCCGCCCGMMQSIRRYDIKNAIVSSNWIMKIDLDACKGCGQCATTCPVEAIAIEKPEGKTADGKKKKGWAVVDEEMCLGCGACYSSCKFGAISMKPRERRVFTPETVFDQMVAMGIERGKLAGLIFSDPTKLSHRALARVISMIEKAPPYKAAMAVRPLRSAFFNAVVAGAKKMSGPIE